jgi:hypothetical protein
MAESITTYPNERTVTIDPGNPIIDMRKVFPNMSQSEYNTVRIIPERKPKYEDFKNADEAQDFINRMMSKWWDKV